MPRSPARPCASAPRRASGPGTPSETRRLASTTSESIVCWTCPGRHDRHRPSIPSRTNSGATRSSTPIGSATRRRSAGVRRSRRSRRREGTRRSRRDVGRAMASSLRGPVAAGTGGRQLGRRCPRPRAPGLVHAGHPGRPGARRRGRPDGDDGGGTGTARPRRSAQATKAFDRRATVNVTASADATLSSIAGPGAAEPPFGRPRPAAPPTLQREAVGDGLRRVVRAREEDPAAPVRPREL